MAKESTPPARPLGWNASAPTVELTLATLIVFKGPGSWKREARWDEYVVVIANKGAEPLVIESAALIDLLGQPQVPGVDPWKLEKLSYTNWDKYGKTGLKLVAGAGTFLLVGTIAYLGTGPILFGGAAAGGAAGASAAALPVLVVVDIAAIAIVNSKNKKKVWAEFDRRRVNLPRTIAPGASVSGSFFFPMTPGPQRLVLKGKAGPVPVELVLDLKQLAGLHLKPADGTKQAGAAP